MAAFLDNCAFQPTAGGTTDWTYSARIAGYNNPADAGVTNGKKYKYYAFSADRSQWEIGEGTYNTGTGVLARTTVLFNSSQTGTAAGQSGAGTKINFSTVPTVVVIAIKEDLLAIDEANAFTTAQKAQATANLKVSGPTVTVLNSGSAATYTTPANCTRIRVRGIGGGGGCGNTGGGQGAGGTTSFAGTGITTMTATGGAAGTGAGGGAAAGGTGSNGHLNYAGGDGMGCWTQIGFIPAQPQANTFLYPQIVMGGATAAANTGRGASDTARNFVSSNSNNGAGGGGGGFERWIDAPAATYTYTIGAGGAAGTGGYAGGSGQIVIEEFYD